MAKAKKPVTSEDEPKAPEEISVSKNVADEGVEGEPQPVVSDVEVEVDSIAEPLAADVSATEETAEQPSAVEDAKEMMSDDSADPAAEEKSDSHEPVAAPVPESPVQPTAIQPTAPEQGSTFWPLLFGGVLAAVLGFFAAELDLFGNRSQMDILRGSVSDQQKRIATLEQTEPAVAVQTEFPELDALASTVSGLSDRLADLDARLTVVEKQPIVGGTSEAAQAAYERELAALQASVEAQRSEIEGLLDNALGVRETTEDVARRATLQSALTLITTALSAGQPFDGALAILIDNGVADIPVALTETATSGVATLGNLQSRFPDSARAALSAARAAGEGPEENGVTGFLRRQLGARSVTPREGDDPDAVLSRAEAAVRDGQLENALSELSSLPQTAQDAIQDWLADARTRQAAQSATQDLSQSLTAN